MAAVILINENNILILIFIELIRNVSLFTSFLETIGFDKLYTELLNHRYGWYLTFLPQI